MVIDFEAAVWQSVKEIFPSVELHGCHFHFAQAVYKNVQSFGLVSEYKKGSVYSLIRKLFALPFLPHSVITVAFQAIKEDANQDDANLKRLLVYFERTWLKSSI